MKRRSKWKLPVILLTVVALLAAAGGGGWYYYQNRTTEPVNVYPFQYIGMTEYWGDSQESYGPVTTDRIQTVYLSDTQTITEVLVSQGDTVKKGDVLLRYDTTLSDIAMEREHLQVEKLKLQLENAQEELYQIQNMKPMVIPEYTPPETSAPELGTALSGEYQISQNKAYDGSSMDKALILWLHTDAALDSSVFEALRQQAEAYQQENQTVVTLPTTAPTEVPPSETTEPDASVDPSTAPTVPPAESTEAPTEETSGETEESTDPTDSTDETDAPEPTAETTTEPAQTTTAPPETTTAPTVPAVPEPEPLEVNRFYVVIKTTADNMSLGYRQMWQGMEVIKENGSFRFKFFDAGTVEDHMVPKQENSVTVMPEIDMGSGYTAEQIAQMRSEKEKQIRDLQFQVKMAEANYAIKKTEIDNGEVTATIDGTVVSLLSEEEAKASRQPFMKVSGGGGFYVEGFVSELTKDDLQIGQEVTVQDWNTGTELVATVQHIGDFPDTNGYWNGMGNPNVSYYPFTVFIDGSADLQEGTYVNVVYSTATTQQGIYLENPFLRTEQGQSYVYVRGVDGKLEKRVVTTGKALWGSYTEILGGITPEDLIAFPYGKTVVEGADTVESDMSALYG